MDDSGTPRAPQPRRAGCGTALAAAAAIPTALHGTEGVEG